MKNIALDKTDDSNSQEAILQHAKQKKTVHTEFLQHTPRLSPKLCLGRLYLMKKQRMSLNGKNVKFEESYFRTAYVKRERNVTGFFL